MDYCTYYEYESGALFTSTAATDPYRKKVPNIGPIH